MITADTMIDTDPAFALLPPMILQQEGSISQRNSVISW